jgi:hypothetical protein
VQFSASVATSILQVSSMAESIHIVLRAQHETHKYIVQAKFGAFYCKGSWYTARSSNAHALLAINLPKTGVTTYVL